MDPLVAEEGAKPLPDPRRSDRALTLLLLAFTALLFLELPGSHLLEPDEARYAEIPREMLKTGDWVTPRINEQPYFEKPPLLYWVNGAALAVLGENPYAARLASRLSALATAAMLLFALGQRPRSGEGRLATLIFLSSLLPFALARMNLIDTLLTASMTACLLALRDFARRRERGESGLWSLVAAGAAAAAGTLAKGLVGALLPGAIFLAWVLLVKRGRLLREVLWSPAPFVFLLLAAPWFGAMERANPGFQELFLLREHFARFTEGAKRSQPFFYFLPVLVLGFLPWIAFLPRVVASLRPFRKSWTRERPDDLYFLLWAAVVFLFFSLSRGKLVPYILPMFPALAAVWAKALATGPRTLRAPLRVTAVTAVVFLGLVLAQPAGTRNLTTHPFVEVVRRYRVPGSTLVTYHTYLHGLPWELKEPVPMASWVGELRPAYERNPEHPLFWQEHDFWKRWNAGEKLIVLTRLRDRGEFRTRSSGPVTHLATVGKHVLLANFTGGAP